MSISKKIGRGRRARPAPEEAEIRFFSANYAHPPRECGCLGQVTASVSAPFQTVRSEGPRGVIVHESNRIEELVGELAELVSRPAGDPARAPLVREAIAVQGRGMERWLSMELARRLGVWANPWFPFPRRLITRAFDAVLGPAPAEAARFEPETLVWTVAQRLGRLEPHVELAGLRAFLADDPRGERRLQLAARLAETFDHYVIYRPDMIAAWERGEEGRQERGEARREEKRDESAPNASGDARWQARLWREIVAQQGAHHLAARARAFLEAVASAGSGHEPLAGLPERVSLFGVTTLPPLYVDVLEALASRVELHLFVLGCTRDPLAEPARMNPLAASLGAVGRDFHRVLEARGIAAPGPAAAFRAPGGPTWLAALQRAVLDGDVSTDSLPPLAADVSIRIHDCHGPMREVEVLHEQLTALFEADASLEPRDVVVMTPDVEQYAPFIESVFDAPGRPGERPRIAYRVADRRVRATHEIVDSFWLLLDVLAGRLPSLAVVDLLMRDRIRRRFEIEDVEVDRLIAWIRAAAIRWGADAAHRAEVGQPRLEQNTWRQGLDRLLLGFALPDGARDLFAGTLPAAGVEAGDADLLGRFALLLETLFAFRERLAAPRPLAAWSVALAQLLERMVDRADDGASQHALLRSALDDLARRAAEVGFEEPVSLASVRSQLEGALEQGIASHEFLTGGVTFCELVPMRSIPFRVVALLGLSDGAFPRTRPAHGFDLLAPSPRPGDRSARDDDRHLFLEALVSARDRLVVTFVGRSPRDGTRRPPSVVVDELVDEVGRLAGLPREDVIDALVTRHPLHPFSPDYFRVASSRAGAGGSALASYSASDCRGARALVGARRVGANASGDARGRPWLQDALGSRAPAEARVVDVAHLVRFFEHPVRFFLQRRFGLFLRDETEGLEEREPLELDALDRWQLADELLPELLRGVPAGEVIARLRAQGSLPPGVAGDLVAERQLESVRALTAEVTARRGGERLPPLAVHLPLGAWRIEGEIDDLAPAGRVTFQISKLPHRRELGFWLQHLLLCAAAPASLSCESVLVAPGSAKRPDEIAVLQLACVPDARERLCDLLALYDEGQRVPLPLFPHSSRIQADACMKRGWQAGPVSAARARFEDGQPPMGPERADPFLLQAFRDVDPLEPDCPLPGDLCFGSLARRVFEPYLQALGEPE
jgi:exodeoxyribonuclease V gamma subunit